MFEPIIWSIVVLGGGAWSRIWHYAGRGVQEIRCNGKEVMVVLVRVRKPAGGKLRGLRFPRGVTASQDAWSRQG